MDHVPDQESAPFLILSTLVISTQRYKPSSPCSLSPLPFDYIDREREKGNERASENHIMGIAGLLPMLKSITTPTHLSAFANQSVAIDAYCWLHRAARACTGDLFSGRPTSMFVDQCMNMIKVLRDHAIEPILVFDGASLPMKRHKELERRQTREQAKTRVKELLTAGVQTVDSQVVALQSKSLDITPEMAHQLILELKLHGIHFIVAPYEADAQLAYLCRTGMASAVLTEDSDLLLFECPVVLFKTDYRACRAEVIRAGDLVKVPDLAPLLKKTFTTKGSLSNHSAFMALFRQVCILAGCDYLPSLPRIGIKTALKHVCLYYNDNRGGGVGAGGGDGVNDGMSLVLASIASVSGTPLPPDYEHSFILAELTFRHQLVYDPCLDKIVHLTPLPEDEVEREGSIYALIHDWSFVGQWKEDNIAKHIATGLVHPETHRPFVVIEAPPSPPPTQHAVKGDPSTLPHLVNDHRLTLKRSYSSMMNKENNASPQRGSLSSHRVAVNARPSFLASPSLLKIEPREGCCGKSSVERKSMLNTGAFKKVQPMKNQGTLREYFQAISAKGTSNLGNAIDGG